MGRYTYSPTVILDIDGVLLETSSQLDQQIRNDSYPKALPGVVEKLKEWDRMGCSIILLTGRPESARRMTIEQLECQGIFYDQLIMGVGGGVRLLVNDRKPVSKEFPDGRVTAFAVSPPRNHGIKDINIELLEDEANGKL